MSTKGHVRARPQIEEGSKQIDVISKWHTRALVLKLMKRADLTTLEHVRASPQIMEVSMQTDVTTKRHAK